MRRSAYSVAVVAVCSVNFVEDGEEEEKDDDEEEEAEENYYLYILPEPVL